MMMDDDECGTIDGMSGRGFSEKTCRSAALCITNPTRPDLGSNSGRHGGKPATNRLSYCTAWHVHCSSEKANERQSEAKIVDTVLYDVTILQLTVHQQILLNYLNRPVDRSTSTYIAYLFISLAITCKSGISLTIDKHLTK
jgi:hypothetical protein